EPVPAENVARGHDAVLERHLVHAGGPQANRVPPLNDADTGGATRHDDGMEGTAVLGGLSDHDEEVGEVRVGGEELIAVDNRAIALPADGGLGIGQLAAHSALAALAGRIPAVADEGGEKLVLQLWRAEQLHHRGGENGDEEREG